MKSIIFPAAVASLASIALAAVQAPIESPKPNTPTVQGCYSTAGDLTFDSTAQWQSSGTCGHDTCLAKGFSVAATTEGSKCYCGNKYPPKSTLSDPLMCNTTCTGYGDACGGLGYFTVYNTGKDLIGIQYSGDPAPAAPGTATSAPPEVETVKVTESAAAEKGAASSSSSSGPNTGAIAAGVVVGVVAVGALVGGFFWFMRRRRNQEIEDEHRRNAAINSFVGGGKPPSSSGGWSNSDSRLDPVMAQRRQSSGSIADDQDYSRKILRVTNA